MRYIGLIILIFVLSASGVQAQNESVSDDETMWYWAWREETGEVFAYNVDGDVNVLLEDVYPYNVRRLDNNMAVVTIFDTDTYYAYLLTSTSAEMLFPAYDQWTMFNIISDFSPELFQWNGMPSVSIVSNRHPVLWLYTEAQGLIRFNVETRELIALGDVGKEEDYYISDDNQTIWYELEGNGGDILWTLNRLEVESGESEIVFTLRNPFESALYREISLACGLESGQDFWWCSAYPINQDGLGNDYNVLFRWHIYRDGRVESILDAGSTSIIYTDFYGNQYTANFEDFIFRPPFDELPAQCEAGCQLEIAPMENPDEIITFVIPSEEASGYNIIVINHPPIIIDDQHLLLVYGGNWNYILSADGDVTFLGATICCGGTIGNARHDHWMVQYREDEYVLWDLLIGEIVMAVSGEGNFHLFRYFEQGMYFDYRHIYSFVDRAEYYVPAPERFRVLEIFPKGRILYAQSEPEAPAGYPQGIYLYTVGEGWDLLIDGADPIPRRFGIETPYYSVVIE